jgi:hypothetical protein
MPRASWTKSRIRRGTELLRLKPQLNLQRRWVLPSVHCFISVGAIYLNLRNAGGSTEAAHSDSTAGYLALEFRVAPGVPAGSFAKRKYGLASSSATLPMISQQSANSADVSN